MGSVPVKMEIGMQACDASPKRFDTPEKAAAYLRRVAGANPDVRAEWRIYRRRTCSGTVYRIDINPLLGYGRMGPWTYTPGYQERHRPEAGWEWMQFHTPRGWSSDRRDGA